MPTLELRFVFQVLWKRRKTKTLNGYILPYLVCNSHVTWTTTRALVLLSLAIASKTVGFICRRAFCQKKRSITTDFKTEKEILCSVVTTNPKRGLTVNNTKIFKRTKGEVDRKTHMIKTLRPLLDATPTPSEKRQNKPNRSSKLHDAISLHQDKPKP